MSPATLAVLAPAIVYGRTQSIRRSSGCRASAAASAFPVTTIVKLERDCAAVRLWRRSGLALYVICVWRCRLLPNYIGHLLFLPRDAL